MSEVLHITCISNVNTNTNKKETHSHCWPMMNRVGDSPMMVACNDSLKDPPSCKATWNALFLMVVVDPLMI